MPTTANPKFIKVPCKRQGEKSRYWVSVGGKTYGTVASVEDSSRTGCMWVARDRNGTYVTTTDSRSAAARVLAPR